LNCLAGLQGHFNIPVEVNKILYAAKACSGQEQGAVPIAEESVIIIQCMIIY
jgi:hypothetical protein